MTRPHPHTQLLDHRAHRPRQVDAGRPHARAHAHHRGPRHDGAGARLDGHRARARHHHQGAGRPRAVRRRRRRRRTSSTSSTRRATSTSPTRSRARSRRARACCSSSTRRRASRRRRSPTRCMAMNADLEIIPVINKIDLPAADPERVRHEIEEGLAIPADEAVLASGKTGEGVREALEAVVRARAAARGRRRTRRSRRSSSTRYFDAYRGVVALIRVVDGAIAQGHEGPHDGDRHRRPTSRRSASAGRRTCRSTSSAWARSATSSPASRTRRSSRSATPSRSPSTARPSRCPGYRDVKPMVYTGLFPIDGDQYPDAARRARQAAAQRPRAHLRARVEPRARLRLPRRVPRPAAHGGRQGAPRARVRPRPARDGAVASSTTRT